MIVFLTTAAHSYTIKSLRSTKSSSIKTLSYTAAFLTPILPRATYIFTDFERMSFWELELASELYRIIRRRGLLVINNPVNFLSRFELLNKLQRSGINSFHVWKAVDVEQVDHYPVFLRHEAAHRGVLSEPIDDADALNSEIRAKLDEGVPIRDMMIVEYASQPDENGIFHKWAMYKVGEKIMPCAGAFDSDWCAKNGVNGIAGDKAYEAELNAIRHSHHAEEIRRVFDLSGMAFGRVDFSLVDGKIQVYEINTNPTIIDPTRTIKEKGHPSEHRLQTYAMVHERLIDALGEIDTSQKGYFLLRGDKLKQHKIRTLKSPFLNWMP